MSILECPECGKDISSRAKACPGCGYPLRSLSQNVAAIKTETKKVNRNLFQWLSNATLKKFVIVCLLLFFAGSLLDLVGLLHEWVEMLGLGFLALYFVYASYKYLINWDRK